ncbi:hypothetical protein HELRODRAFT_191759 [Helobdella robusta]|uniref:Peptidase M12B domain-containing protein n=1 Tax=Helobdella robusta TaxID=6412 RepID=T1FTA3_HELRO|nr:hypothetical protein HELRODRAFT_191759 [Helobdella robusta]ESO04315.1 hypothetical protein HELRODRAFT_191759 [Helobdella robusta]
MNDKDKAIQMLRYHFAHIAHGLSPYVRSYESYQNESISERAYLFSSIDQKYKSIDNTKYRFSFKLVNYIICQNPSASNFIEKSKINDNTYNIYSALDNLTEWNYNRTMDHKNNKIKLRKYDVAVAFTNYISGLVLGLAHVGSACKTTGITVVGHRGQQNTIVTATHEIGHILGAFHDEDRNDCPKDDIYIMSPVYQPYAKNHYETFSPCARNYFEEYASKLDDKGENCMLKSDMNDQHEDLDQYLNDLPGTKYSPNVQCMMLFGDNFKYCPPSNKNYAKICSEFYCWDPVKQRCVSQGGAAMPGTSCGDKMWCINYQCVKDPRAPAAQDSCLFGDSPVTIDMNYDPFTCADVAGNPQRYCTRQFVRDDCCNACSGFKEETIEPTQASTTQRPTTTTQPPSSNECVADARPDWCSELITPYHKRLNCKNYAVPCCKTCEDYLWFRK